MKPTDSYKSGPTPTNVWYHDDTVPENNINPVEITRQPNQTQAPRDGEEFKTNFNYEDNSEDYVPKVDGIVKMDKRNPIWQYTDEQIKLGFIKKLQDQYNFITPQNVEFHIDRAEGTVQYNYRKELAVASRKIKSARHFVPFSGLGTGDSFYMDKTGIQNQAPGLWEKWEKDFGKAITDQDKFIKKGETFCIYKGKDKTGRCIKAEYPFQKLAKGAEFNLDIKLLESEADPQVMEAFRAKVPTMTEFTVFVKIDEKSFMPKKRKESDNEKQEQKSLKDWQAKNTIIMPNAGEANKLPVLFRVWNVIVEDTETAPGAVKLKNIDVWSIFTFSGSAVPSDFATKTYKPTETEFLKVSKDYFKLWKGGKVKLPEILTDDEASDAQTRIANFLDEQRQKRNVADPTFFISKGDRGHTDWLNQEVSGEEMVFVKDEITPKKKSSVEAVLEGMFKKVETKTDDLGEYIKVQPKDVEHELEGAGFHWQDLINKSEGEKEISVPKANGKGNETKKVRVGATEKFSWTIDTKPDQDGRYWMVINKVK